MINELLTKWLDFLHRDAKIPATKPAKIPIGAALGCLFCTQKGSLGLDLRANRPSGPLGAGHPLVVRSTLKGLAPLRPSGPLAPSSFFCPQGKKEKKENALWIGPWLFAFEDVDARVSRLKTESQKSKKALNEFVSFGLPNGRDFLGGGQQIYSWNALSSEQERFCLDFRFDQEFCAFWQDTGFAEGGEKLKTFEGLIARWDQDLPRWCRRRGRFFYVNLGLLGLTEQNTRKMLQDQEVLLNEWNFFEHFLWFDLPVCFSPPFLEMTRKSVFHFLSLLGKKDQQGLV